MDVIDSHRQEFRAAGRARGFALAAMFIGAASISIQCTQISILAVDTLDDLADTSPGDGACRTASGDCSLRAAIQEANAQGGRQEIRIPEGFYLLSRMGAQEDQGSTGDLDVRDDLGIRSLGTAAHTIIDAQGIDRVFDLHSGAHLLLEGVMVQGGEADGDAINGAGIRVGDGAALNLNRAMVNGNHAVGNGAGIYNLGQTVILRTTISHNRSDADGGGIYNAGVLGLSMSTVSTNSAVGNGGGLGQSSSADTMIGNATFNLNAANAGGAVDSQQGSVSMVNTILANSLTGGNCTPAPIASSGHNLSSDSSCELESATDVTDVDPMLSGLHSFAGQGLPVHMLLQGSPADGAGDSAVVNIEAGDQLDTVRPAIQIGAAGIFDDVLGVLGRLYVPTYATSGPGGEVRIYNTQNHSLVTTMPVPDVRAAAVNPYGSLLFLARGRYQDNTVPNELLVYALPSLNHLYTVPLPGVPNAVAASASSMMVYVVGSNFALNSGYVSAINSGTAVLSSSLTGLDVLPLNMDADLGSTSVLLFVTGYSSGTSSEEIRIYSTFTETFLPSALIANGSPSVAIAPGISPSRMYVNGFDTSVPMFAGWITSVAPLGSLPKTVSVGDIVVHPDGNRVYAGDNSNVDAIDVGAGVVTATINAGGSSLAVHPSGYWVYGGNAFGSVDLIIPSTNTVSSTLSVTSSHSISKMAVQP